MTSQTINPLVVQLMHGPFSQVAEALRATADGITHAWDAAVREAMPQMRHLTYDQLKDSTPEILDAIAAALESNDPELIGELVLKAPQQGTARFEQNFDVIEVMQEDRLLRALIVMYVEEELGRRLDVPESAALHVAVDIMLQRSVIAMVDRQKAQLRAAAETELKYLSFLSHDMNNHLATVTLWLGLLGMDLKRAGGFPQAEESLATAQQSIDDTVRAMRQMLQHERLRKSDARPVSAPVELHALARGVVAQCAAEAEAKRVKLVIDIRPDTAVRLNKELILVILQNLVGNAVKFSESGTVRIGVNDDEPLTTGRVLSVSDEGPGIAPETLGHIFDAFRRGEIHEQPGVGLGLAIASHAAKLMGAELKAHSTVGKGSTFRLHFPGG